MNNTQDLIHGFVRDRTPQHYITFGRCESTKSDLFNEENNKFSPEILFDSRKFGLHLHQRTGNTPNEREVLTSIPFRQGVVDMSKMLGHRIYENREITYVFYRFGVNRGRARDFHTTIENLLMREFDTNLYDSFEPDFYYRGKCESVIVEDDYDRNRLRIEITFNLYPFKIDKHTEVDDLFDPFNFDIDALQDLSFEVADAEVKDFALYNSSQQVVRPQITVVGAPVYISIVKTVNGVETLSTREIDTDGTTSNSVIRLEQGMNQLRFKRKETEDEGLAKVSFNWRKERI